MAKNSKDYKDVYFRYQHNLKQARTHFFFYLKTEGHVLYIDSLIHHYDRNTAKTLIFVPCPARIHIT